MNSQRGLAVVEDAIDIARSRGEVFDYCSDLTREPEWNPKAKRVEKVTDGPTGLGTRYEAEFLQGNPMTIELVRFDRPVVGVRRSLSPPGCQGRGAGLGDRAGGAPRDADAAPAEGNASVVAAGPGSLHAEAGRAQSRRDQRSIGSVWRKRRSGRRLIGQHRDAHARRTWHDRCGYMGASLTMTERHYGHLARDGREHAIRLLDELSAEQRPRWTLVDAAWTPEPAASASADNGNMRYAGEKSKPSDGLEPSTPSLPCDPNGNRWRPVATVSPQIKPF
jgi:hypothetical protein